MTQELYHNDYHLAPPPFNAVSRCYDADSSIETMFRNAARPVALAFATLLSLHIGASAQENHPLRLAFSLFEQYLEPLRLQAGIPGLSAVIVQDGDIVWARAFGHRDVEAALPARTDTPYPIADLTQTFTSVMLLTCVEQGLLDLSQPIGNWSPLVSDGSATLRQLLAHVSPTGPTPFKYDPARFAMLAAPLEACRRQPYRKLLAQHVLDRLVMIDAVPGRDIATTPPEVRELFTEAALERYAGAINRIAVPYKVDRRGRPTRNELPPGTIDASKGLIASALDLASYDSGLDVLLLPDTRTTMWTNSATETVSLPTTLGWFGQVFEGERLIWHFGLMPEMYSSLYLKIPGRRLTLILLANSDGLSGPYSLEKGDVTSSVFAKTFLRLFL